MIKFYNLPHGPGECAVIHSTEPGNYIDARGDRLAVIAVDCFTNLRRYERALPEYDFVQMRRLPILSPADDYRDFLLIEFKAKGTQ